MADCRTWLPFSPPRDELEWLVVYSDPNGYSMTFHSTEDAALERAGQDSDAVYVTRVAWRRE